MYCNCTRCKREASNWFVNSEMSALFIYLYEVQYHAMGPLCRRRHANKSGPLYSKRVQITCNPNHRSSHCPHPLHFIHFCTSLPGAPLPTLPFIYLHPLPAASPCLPCPRPRPRRQRPPPPWSSSSSAPSRPPRPPSSSTTRTRSAPP